jgi:hypothetical protein
VLASIPKPVLITGLVVVIAVSLAFVVARVLRRGTGPPPEERNAQPPARVQAAGLHAT